MALAVCLLLDRRTERRLVNLWQSLEAAGIASLPSHTHGHHVPHISYAVLRTFDVDEVRRALEALPAEGPLELHLDAVGFFRRGRAALVPAVSVELARRQERVVRAVESTGADLHVHYRPGQWVPHCSISTRLRREQVGDLTALAYDVLPVDGVADRVALVDSSTGEQWPLAHLV